MDHTLLIIYCILSAIHVYPLRLSLYILSTKGLNILNTAHGIFMLHSIFPIFVGDILIVVSAVTESEFDAFSIVEMADFIGILMFQTLFLNLFHYRSTLLYKRVALRFYDYVYNLLVVKAIASPAMCIFGVIVSSALQYSITSFLIVFQVFIASGTVVMYFSSQKI